MPSAISNSKMPNMSVDDFDESLSTAVQPGTRASVIENATRRFMPYGMISVPTRHRRPPGSVAPLI